MYFKKLLFDSYLINFREGAEQQGHGILICSLPIWLFFQCERNVILLNFGTV